MKFEVLSNIQDGDKKFVKGDLMEGEVDSPKMKQLLLAKVVKPVEKAEPKAPKAK